MEEAIHENQRQILWALSRLMTSSSGFHSMHFGAWVNHDGATTWQGRKKKHVAFFSPALFICRNPRASFSHFSSRSALFLINYELLSPQLHSHAHTGTYVKHHSLNVYSSISLSAVCELWSAPYVETKLRGTFLLHVTQQLIWMNMISYMVWSNK